MGSNQGSIYSCRQEMFITYAIVNIGFVYNLSELLILDQSATSTSHPQVTIKLYLINL